MIIPEGRRVGAGGKLGFLMLQAALIAFFSFQSINPEDAVVHQTELKLYFYSSIFLMLGNGLSSISDERFEWPSLLLALVVQGLAQQLYFPLAALYSPAGLSLTRLRGSLGLGLCMFLVLSPLLSKVSVLVVLLIMLAVAPGYCLFDYLIIRGGLTDTAGILKDHLYPGTVGLVLTCFLGRFVTRRAYNKLLRPFEQNVISTVGSIFSMVYLPYILSGGQGPLLLNVVLGQVGSNISAFMTAYMINGQLAASDMMVMSAVGSTTIALYSHLLTIPAMALFVGWLSGTVFVISANAAFLKSTASDRRLFQTKLDSADPPAPIRYKYFDPGLSFVAQVVPSFASILTAVILISTFRPATALSPRDYSQRLLGFSLLALGLGLAVGLLLVAILKALHRLNPALINEEAHE
jgi:hypothetical protein